MNFWSDVEKEYNELSGDSQTEEFNELLSDIKKDIKKIPKADVFPSLSSNEVEEEVLPEEDSDSDQEGKTSLTPKSKKKRCKVGGKTYEVGERWQDEKTGKNMICILMNIPKNVQPLLADADIFTPSTAEKDKSEWTRPSEEPQWSYTATPITKQCQDNNSSRKSSGKSDKTESDPIKEKKDNNEKENVTSSEQTKHQSISSAIDKPETQIEEQTDKTNKEPEIIVVDPPETKSEENEGEGSEKENESEDEEESDDDEKNVDDKTKEPETIKTQKTDTENIKDENGSEIDNDSKKDMKSENIKLKNSEYPADMDSKSKSLDENNKPQHTKENSSEQEVNNGHTPADIHANAEDSTKNSDNQSAESKDNQQPEKGEPIYTKETVVVQRKLIKTEQTIETTETDKTKQ